MNEKAYEQGYIQIYTGNGKGKTSAAVGVIMRSIAAGFQVFFGQFMKGQETGEISIFSRFPDNIKVIRSGTPKFLMGKPSKEDIRLARECWEQCVEEINSDKYNLVVLDELNMAVFFELLPVDEVVSVLKNKPKRLEIIMTGRYAAKELIDVANLVTEMKEIKHYYTEGVQARVGIES